MGSNVPLVSPRASDLLTQPPSSHLCHHPEVPSDLRRPEALGEREWVGLVRRRVKAEWNTEAHTYRASAERGGSRWDRTGDVLDMALLQLTPASSNGFPCHSFPLGLPRPLGLPGIGS